MFLESAKMKLAPLAIFAAIVGFALIFTPVFLLSGGTVAIGQSTNFSPVFGTGLINASQKTDASYNVLVAGALTTSVNESGGQVQDYSSGGLLLGPSLVVVIGVAVAIIAYFVIRKNPLGL